MTNHLWVVKAMLYAVVLIGVTTSLLERIMLIENPALALLVAVVLVVVYLIVGGKLLEWVLTR